MGGVGSGAKPREYPPALVEQVQRMYSDGMTIAEIQAVLPRGFKAQRIVERHVPIRRTPAKREQRGERNAAWKGDEASYTALHLRVVVARGKPSECENCGIREGRFEWANLTGRYEDVDDYARLCVSCHRKLDAARRRETGARTSPTRGGEAHV